MITVVQQPATAGTFELEGYQQAYRVNCSPGGGTSTQRLDVPEDKVFCFEYLFGMTSGDSTAPAPDLTVPLENIYIDGVKLYPNNQSDLTYDDNGGPIWPGNDKSSIIKVKEYIEIRGVVNNASHAQADWRNRAWLYLAGFFAEA